VELRAWRDLCHRLEALGESLLDDAYPAAPEDRAEGFAHLAEQVVCWLGWSVGHADPRRPAFHRQNDLVTQWGGPNADNAYRHARVHPSLRYRLRGHMHGCDDFILAIRAGFMHEPRHGTLVEVTGSDLGIGRGDEIDLLLGEGAIPLPEGSAMVSIREYYIDWQEEEPAVWTIACLDEDQPAPPADGEAVAAQLADAATSIEHSMRYWRDYMLDARAAGRPNTFAASQRVAKGLPSARYAFCFWHLGPDEALVIDTDVPAARYWGLQLYSMGWFEPIDPTGRITSLNQAQTSVGPDGRVQVVVAHADPGTPNWLDTGGRGDGLLTLRWFWPDSDQAPAPTATVIPFEAAGRARPEMAQRRAHLAWRFRT